MANPTNIYDYTVLESSIEFSGGTEYEAFDIVWYDEGGSNGKQFYYALKAVPAGTTPAINSTFWGGRTYVNNSDISQGRTYKFPFIPSYSNTADQNPSFTVVQFGDGYKSISNRAINNNLLKLRLTFDKRSLKEAAAISHFLDQRTINDNQHSFKFTAPPPFAVDKIFYCPKWDLTDSFYDNFTIKVDFEELP